MIYINNDLPWIGSTDKVGIGFTAKPAFLYNKNIFDGLIACGLLQVDCTGDVDWSIDPDTLIFNGMGNSQQLRVTLLGFYVVKMFSITKPTLYLRVDFGFQEAGTTECKTTPFFKMTFGTNCSSDGVLSGVQASAGFQSTVNLPLEVGYGPSASYQNTGIRPLYISSDGENYLTLSIDPANIGYTSNLPGYYYGIPGWFALERSIDPATGSYDSDGFFYVTASHERAGNIGRFGYIDFQTQSITAAGAVPAQVPYPWNSSQAGGSNIIMPITCCSPKIKAPMRSCAFYFRSEIQTARRFNVSMSGESVTLMALGPAANGPIWNSGGMTVYSGVYVAPAIRFQ